MRRRALLLAGAASAVPSWAGGQCVTDTPAVNACQGGVYVGGSAGPDPNAPSLDLNFAGGVLDPRITFTRAAGPATYFDAAGVIQTAGTNVARFDYDPVTHAPRGLLIEEARTNLLLNSATLGTQSVAVTAQAYTLSFYGTGTVALSGTFVGSLVGAGAFPARNALTFTPTAGTLTLTVTGSVLNAQIEAGAFATSWITTTGASATRGADVAVMPVGAWFNAAAGTLVVDIMKPYVVPTGAFPRWVELTDSTVNNRVSMNGTNPAITAYLMNVAGVTQASGSLTGAYTPGAVLKAGIAWQAGTQRGCLNGGAVFSASGALVPTVTQLQIGANHAGATNANGWISRTRYWPRVLSAAELQATTI